MKIYYYIPYHEKPSWGIGIVMHHVSMLNKNGFDACAIIKDNKTSYNWLDFKVKSITRKEFYASGVDYKDVLVVPEVSVGLDKLKSLKCTKVLFIQNVGYIFNALPAVESHQSLGFDYVFSIMPHMTPIIEKYIGLPEIIIPPFISNIFFNEAPWPNQKSNLITMFPKFDQPDYSVVQSLLSQKIGLNKYDFLNRKAWRIKELRGLTHKQVAKTMKKSKIFIALNTFESLNASIVEAMAAGCIVFTYEGFGSRDFIKDKVNCFSFPNNEPYKLTEAVYDFLDKGIADDDYCQNIISEAWITAKKYNRARTEEKLIGFFNSLWLKE